MTEKQQTGGRLTYEKVGGTPRTIGIKLLI